MKIETININNIKPYWRNPRKNAEAVEGVKNSIKKYGYNSPILIDKDNIIISGHTRYLALQEMEHTNIAIIRLDLDEQKAKESRIVDNKSSELAIWDNEKLMQELREVSDIEHMQQYFLDMNLDSMISENLQVKPINYTDENFEKSFNKEQDKFINNTQENLHRVLCPHCLKEHFINRDEINGFNPDN